MYDLIPEWIFLIKVLNTVVLIYICSEQYTFRTTIQWAWINEKKLILFNNRIYIEMIMIKQNCFMRKVNANWFLSVKALNICETVENTPIFSVYHTIFFQMKLQTIKLKIWRKRFLFYHLMLTHPLFLLDIRIHGLGV